MNTEKRISGNCDSDCSGWQECYSYMTGEPEEPLTTALAEQNPICPFCGKSAVYEKVEKDDETY